MVPILYLSAALRQISAFKMAFLCGWFATILEKAALNAIQVINTCAINGTIQAILQK